MSDLLARLQRDHSNFARLHVLLEQQAALMDRGETANFRLLSDIMRYMAVYPDVNHHPTEDLIFAKLASRAPEARAAVSDLQEEHRRLSEVGRAFANLVSAVLGGGITPLDKLRGLMWEYLLLNRGHLAREEAEVFPHAARALTSEDWKEIEATLSASTDPLFGEVVDHSYHCLLDLIERKR